MSIGYLSKELIAQKVFSLLFYMFVLLVLRVKLNPEKVLLITP